MEPNKLLHGWFMKREMSVMNCGALFSYGWMWEGCWGFVTKVKIGLIQDLNAFKHNLRHKVCKKQFSYIISTRTPTRSHFNSNFSFIFEISADYV